MLLVQRRRDEDRPQDNTDMHHLKKGGEKQKRNTNYANQLIAKKIIETLQKEWDHRN